MSSKGEDMSYLTRIQSIIQSKKALRIVNATTVPLGGVGFSANCGTWSASNTVPTYDLITNFSMTIETGGNPVIALVVPDPTNANGGGYISNSNASFLFQFQRGSTLFYSGKVNAGGNAALPAFIGIDFPPAGTYTYDGLGANDNSSGSANINFCCMVIFEL